MVVIVPTYNERDWPWRRRMLSVRDATAGFKAWDVDALRTLDPETAMSGGYSFQVEMAHRVTVAGFTAVEVPIHFAERMPARS